MLEVVHNPLEVAKTPFGCGFIHLYLLGDKQSIQNLMKPILIVFVQLCHFLGTPDLLYGVACDEALHPYASTAYACEPYLEIWQTPDNTSMCLLQKLGP